MPFYVYIIQSQKDGTFYKGSSSDPLNRLKMHNLGLSRYTKSKLPWKLVYIEQLYTKSEMLVREKKIKRGNKIYYQKLINGAKNILNNFIPNRDDLNF